jgi:hypothetical protein
MPRENPDAEAQLKLEHHIHELLFA